MVASSSRRSMSNSSIGINNNNNMNSSMRSHGGNTKDSQRSGLGGSNRDLRSSLRNLLVDTSQETNMKRRSSLRDMEVPDTKVKNRRDSRTTTLTSSSTSSTTKMNNKAVTVALPGSIVEGTITRTSKGQALGLSMAKMADGNIMITKTLSGGLAVQQTPLRYGDVILSMNGQDCTVASGGKTIEDVAAMLTASDKVEIRAQKPILEVGTVITALLVKETTKTPLGITLTGSTKVATDPIMIGSVAHDSLAYHTKLDPGMHIVTINDQDCRLKSLREVQRLLSNAPAGTVTIQVRVPNTLKASDSVQNCYQKPILAVGTVITAVMEKYPAKTPLGITLTGSTRVADDPVVIASVAHDSLAYHTKLVPGMHIVAINNQDCRLKSLSEVQQLLAQTPAGTVTIQARVPNTLKAAA